MQTNDYPMNVIKRIQADLERIMSLNIDKASAALKVLKMQVDNYIDFNEASPHQ